MSIFLSTSVTLNYFEKYKNFLNSVNKNSPFNNSCICVDFLPSQEEQEKYKNISFIYCDSKDVISKKNDKWPANRKTYLTLQGGEFLNYIDCKDEDTIIFADYDTTMQRIPTKEEIDQFTNIEENVYCMQLEGFMSLLQHTLDALITTTKNKNEVMAMFPNAENYKPHNAGFLYSSKQNLSKSFDLYKEMFTKFLPSLRSHAATQTIINYCFQHYGSVKQCPLSMTNAHWYATYGKQCKVNKGNKLSINNEEILFVHDKFIINLSY